MPKVRIRGRIQNPQYKKVGEVDGVKVITLKAGGSMSLPKIAGKSRMYILENFAGERKKIGIYDSKGNIEKEIHFDNGHKNRYPDGTIEKLKRGVAHVHEPKGEWGSYARYMTAKEIQQYGALVIKLGGKVSE